ncbi:MAG: DUF2336 domain-containing protein [Rhodospirillales bacterium]|jgi:uncharacterized protein (DUF2336 family)|nr:DUF2336 domain-containing protein [Rhodospirillales bacterium]
MNTVDIDELYRLARQKSVEGRSALAETVSDLFSGESRVLTTRERSLMFDILHSIIRDVEMSVRKRVSAHVAGYSDAPGGLINLLANDEIEVAYPVLVKTAVIKDSDLVEVVRNRTLEHQLAIAIRQDVSKLVSDALVEHGDGAVVRTLLENKNAKISRITMETLVEQSRRVNTFQEPILRRRELGGDLAKRMFLWVSAALRQTIVKQFDLDQVTVDDLLEKAVFEEIENMESEGRTPEKRTELTDSLLKNKEATPELLLSILEQGEVAMFISVFAGMTKLAEKLVMRMLFEPGGEGLAIACKSIGLDKMIFSSIFSLSRKARPNLRKTLQRDLRRSLGLYDQMSQEAAYKVLRLWQRDTEYLTAIRELEVSF